MTVWTVYTSWRAHGSQPACETRDACPDWPTARRRALHLACLAGARYVSVQGPGDVVVADWDWCTNRWREYPRALAVVGFHDSDAWETVSGWVWSCRTCHARGDADSEADACAQKARHDAGPVAWWVAAFAEPVAVAGAAPTDPRGTAP